METSNNPTNNNTSNDIPNQSTHEVTAAQLKRQRIRQLLVSLIGVAILVWGIVKIGCMFMDYKSNEKSDDAQVEQYISPVNLRASGYIKKIYFKEHQDVKKGDTLLVLDDREYRIRVMEAEAALKDAMAGANVVDASLQTTQTSATVYEASIAEIEIRLAKLEKDRQRYQNLVARNAATPIQLEQIETEYNATKKKLDATRRQQKAAYSGVNEVQTRKKNTAAAIERAKAALEVAKLNLLLRGDRSLRWQTRPSFARRRTGCQRRSDHHLHHARHPEVGHRQLQGDPGGEALCGPEGHHDRRRL